MKKKPNRRALGAQAAPLEFNLNSNTDRTLWLAIFALVCAGAVMVYSSSFIFAQERFHDGMYFFKKHLLFILIGAGAFVVGLKLPLLTMKEKMKEILIFSAFLLLLCLIPGISQKVGGAKRWIQLFGFGFQPAEFAKFAVLLFLATQLEKKTNTPETSGVNFRTNVLAFFIPIVPIYVLLLCQPDFGSTALLLATTVFVLLACGIKMGYLIASVVSLIPIASVLILTKSYRLNRVIAFLDPWSDPAHKGFQVIQSLLAFFSGKWFGVGLGNSREKLFYLPEAHNDFIFSVIGEELGLFGVFFFTGLFLTVILKGLKIADSTTNTFHRALAVGITCMIGLQAFFNMAVVLGLLPTKGLPLPLISYGGTSLIMNLFMLGLLSQIGDKQA